MDTVVPKRGMQFRHATQLTKIDGLPVHEWPPAVCTVTKVTRHAVYYRNHTGFLSHTTPERFPTIVLETIQPPTT